MQITAVRLCLSLIFVGVAHLSLAQTTTERLTAAEALWESAYRQSGPEREDRQLQAIELLLQPDTRDQARSYLLQLIDWRLTDPDLLARRDVVLAALALFDGRPEAALNLLPPVGRLPRHHGLRILELKAQALAASGQTKLGLDARMLLARHLTEPAARSQNDAHIWRILQAASPAELAQWKARERDEDYQGWLSLAQIERTAPAPAELDRQRSAWLLQNPDHTAAGRFLPAEQLPTPAKAEELEKYDQFPEKP